MLQLTQAAAVQLAHARESQGLPETFGLRVFGEQQAQGGLSLSLAFAEAPAEEDHVTEQQGTRLFIAPDVVEPLAGAALDVQQTAEGTALVLTPQETGLGD